MKNNYQHLAAMAVFRNMYNARKDVYNLIWNFIVKEIRERNIYFFELDDIVQYVNESNDLELPRAVIKTALHRNRMAVEKSKEDGSYVLKKDFEALTQSLLNEQDAIKEQTEIENKVVIPLIKYIEEQEEQVLNKEEKDDVVIELTHYLSNEICERYNEHISKFIIANERNEEVALNLRKLKEGIIIYEGICYCGKEKDLFQAWDAEINLFLDTDVIFSMMGYNGKLFQNQFDELYDYIKDINSRFRNKRSKKRIRLFYFKEVEDEINWYFKKAEYIVENKEELEPSRTAMKSIVNGYSCIAEINSQKIKLFQKLDAMNIKLYSEDFYSEEKYEGNGIDLKTLDNVKKNFGHGEDVEKHITKINYIKILRGSSKITKFEDAKYFLLTANGVAFQIAKKYFRKEHDVTLITSYDELINRFWFQSNKGLGSNEFPRSLDIVCKARKIISATESAKIRESYELLKQEFQEGKITKEIILAEYSDMRRKSILPEDVSAEILDDLYVPITQKDVERYLDEREKKQKKIEENDLKIEKLQEEGNLKEATIEKLKEESRQKDQRLLYYQQLEDRYKDIKKKWITGTKVFLFIIMICLAVFLYIKQYETFAKLAMIIPIIQLFWEGLKKYILKSPKKTLIEINSSDT